MIKIQKNLRNGGMNCLKKIERALKSSLIENIVWKYLFYKGGK